ncbi:FecR family protein [Pseudopedobacter sp.]|uniref:FecR family protein n=1 Tax=Pseudopedobacter sp. TaxID=1936787 RepID=UPI003340F5EC
MNKKALLELVEKYNKGVATERERAFLEAYYKLFDLSDDGLEAMHETERLRLKDSMRDYLHQNIVIEEVILPKLKVSYWKWAAAAVLLIAFTITIQFIQQSGKKELNTKNSVDSLIVPGSNQAVLTLANGSNIVLNDKAEGTLSNESGVIISKNNDGLLTYEITENALASINTLTTPRGGQYQLILSDGTKVWLNADTKITFPTRFKGEERRVDIVGEAYFEVAKNKYKPFKIHTQNQIIEVLGTHFNVNSYVEDETAKTTLLEGSIKVSLLGNSKSGEILSPGEAAILSKKTSNLNVVSSDTEMDIAWKNGYFKFNNTDMRSLMSQVARWYNVDVEYRGEITKDLFGGKLKRSNNIQEILRILELSNIDVEIDGRTIIVSNKP